MDHRRRIRLEVAVRSVGAEGPALTADSEGGAVRAGGSGSRGCPEASADGAGPRLATPAGWMSPRHRGRCVRPGAARLIPEMADPGPLRELADEFQVDRLRDRSDCGGVHRVSEIPAARAVAIIPALCRHFPASPHRGASGRTLPAEARTPDRTAGAPRGARPTMKGPSLYDLDFFWMTGTNHCSLDRKLRPWRGGGPSGLTGYLASGRSAKPWRCASACLVP